MRNLLSLLLVYMLIISASQAQVGTKETKKLIDSYQRAQKKNNKSLSAELSNKLGLIYWHEGELESAVEYFETSANLYEETSDDRSLQGVYYSLGLVSAEKKSHQEAIRYFQKAAKIAKNYSDRNLLANILLETSLSYSALDKIKKAIKSLEEALPIALELDHLDLKKHCYLLLSDFNTKIGNETKAQGYLENYTMLVESIKNEQLAEKTSDQMSRIAGQLKKSKIEGEAAKTALVNQAEQLSKTKEILKEVERLAVQKQNQVNLLNTEKALKEMTIKAQEANLKTSSILINSFIVGFLLVSALVVVILVDAKKKRVANEKIHLQHLHISSSINYAQRIQQAMLPKRQDAADFALENTFILFKPRDVVSGDFYWFRKLPESNDFVVAAVDCTGHGVPGAFMSMVGMNALNNIVGRGITEANLILDELHKEIRTSLSQEETGNVDGMDMSLCIIRENKKQIEFAGAKNPLVYIQNGETYKLKADVHPIGGGKYSTEKPFTKHIIDVNVDTTVYMFSDGFQDQFGGPENRKFMSKNFRNLLSDIHHLPMDDQRIKLDETIGAWMDNYKQTDDILVFGFKVMA